MEPPYSVAYEQALLACCMLEGWQDTVAKCVELKLSPASFYLPAHQEIFKVCLSLFQKGKPVNSVTIEERLRADGTLKQVGSVEYLNEISNSIETPVDFLFYAQEVKRLEIARNLVHFFQKGIEDAYRGVQDMDRFLDNIESQVLQINQERVVDTAQPFQRPLDKASNTIKNLLTNKDTINGIASGFKDLDNLTNGFRAGEMIVIAGRPSLGKTALALNIAENVLLQNGGRNPVPTLFFSLEMSAEQLAMRMICSSGKVNMTKLRAGFLRDSETQQRLALVEKTFKKVPFWIDESSNLTILEMRSKARRLHAQNRLGLVVIDYLQLLAGTEAQLQREQQIAEISRGVKAMAKELNVPVIVLSQLNRESEKEFRQPMLSDLRESGSIEQDADVVLLLSKSMEDIKAMKRTMHEDFGEDSAPSNESFQDTVVRDLILAKQRNGPVGTVRLTYCKPYTRFENYTE